MSAPAVARTLPETSVRAALRSPRRLRTEIFAGLVVALALIPETISFSVIAGVDPRVGLFTSITMAITLSIAGGRPAMVAGAAGATALVMAPLVRSHGVEYLVAAVLLGGLFQVVLGLVGVARLMRFVPRSVMVGFVNALAILIFTAQIPNVVGQTWLVWPVVLGGIAIIIVFRRITTVVPAPLVAIIVVTVVTALIHLAVPTVGSESTMPDTLPVPGLPAVPWTWPTLEIIAPYALGMALVGLLESLMTARLVDDITDTHSSKTREAWGQGLGNLVTGLFGGMGGCAMIGQTMINVRASNGRTRISCLLAGVFLLVLVVAAPGVVAVIPMSALTAVMVMVSIGTFDWHSIRPSTLRRMPPSETIIMVITVVVVVATSNLAIGVVIGTVVAMIAFARRVAHVSRVRRVVDTDGPDQAPTTVTYFVSGELFFASSNDLVTQFSYAEDPPQVIVDMSDAHIWDASTVAALDAIETRYQGKGKKVTFTGLNKASSERRRRLSGTFGPS